jgi:hypothetical protein
MAKFVRTGLSDKHQLQIIFCYLQHQINPQKTIPLDYLENLHVGDIDAITEDMFEMHEYSKKEIESMIEGLHEIIIKLEKDETNK